MSGSVSWCIAAVAVRGRHRPWVGYNLTRFNEVVTISTGFDPTVAVSNCDTVYYGPLTGYWSRPCILRMPVPTKGDVPAQEAAYRRVALKYIEQPQVPPPDGGGRPGGADVRVLPAVAADQARPDRDARAAVLRDRPRHVLRAARRHRSRVCGPCGGGRSRSRRSIATVATVAFAVAITFGQTRHRASAEPVLVVAAAVGFVELVRALRSRGDGPRRAGHRRGAGGGGARAGRHPARPAP